MDPVPSLRAPAFPIVVSGPSGVGKTVLCRRLCEALPWTALSISATTRPMRAGEREGESYFFYDRERFLRERDAGGLAEWAEVHGHLYGTPRAWLDRKLREGRSVVLNIDVQGGLALRRSYRESVLVFVLPPSLGVLAERLENRGTDRAEEIRRRVETAVREMAELPEYHYAVVNEVLEEAVGELIAIARAERARVARRLGPEAGSVEP
jgi:guanylate kinase